MIGWSGNLGRISESDEVSDRQQVTASENQMNAALWAWVVEQVWNIDKEVLPKRDHYV